MQNSLEKTLASDLLYWTQPRCQYKVNGCNVMSHAWGVIFYLGSTPKMSIQLPAIFGHRHDSDWKIVESDVKLEYIVATVSVLRIYAKITHITKTCLYNFDSFTPHFI